MEWLGLPVKACLPRRSPSSGHSMDRLRAPMTEDHPGAVGSAPQHPDHIGSYRILRVLGEGAFGVVYRAHCPTRRQDVAIKVLLSESPTREVLSRFKQERRALGMMNHDAIAKLLDLGETADGRPYVVMELVDGMPLTAHCDRYKLSLDERLRLFQKVCDGVQHAHSKGVFHRDLKPGNILCVREGDQSMPKIVDFGLAKARHRETLGGSIVSGSEAVGTLEYMPPEQAGGDGIEQADATSDVYSLGVILYELLVGDLPFPSHELRKSGSMDARRIILEEDPIRPSQRLQRRDDRGEVASLRRVSLGHLTNALRRDLDWLVMQALRKQQSERYDSASALSADVERYLQTEPLEARPPSTTYHLRKFTKRYRLQLGAAVTVIVASLVFGGWALRERGVAQEQKEEADRQREIAQQREKEADEQRSLVESKVRDFNQLSGRVRYDAVVSGATRLLEEAAWPQASEAMQAWLTDCDALLGMRGDIEETVESLGGLANRDDAQSFLFDTLSDLLGKLDRLATRERPLVARRQEWADGIGGLTRSHPDAGMSWEGVREALSKADGEVASALYAGVEIPVPEEGWLGLVPMGANRKTKLLEFYDLRSACDGDITVAASLQLPSRDSEGRIDMSADQGIVFVMLPVCCAWSC